MRRGAIGLAPVTDDREACRSADREERERAHVVIPLAARGVGRDFLRRHRDAVGREVEVLVESARTEAGVPGERFGRSRENWTVHFQGDCAAADVVRVRVTRASLVALSGVQESVSDPAPFAPAKVRRTRLAVLSG